MGTLVLQIPQAGQPNSTEDPKVASSLTALSTWANGGIDTVNLNPAAAIKASQMAAGAVRWQNVTSAATAITAADGQLIESTANAAVAVTLPPATGGQLVGVVAGVNASGSQQVTIAAAGTDKIYGLGVSGGVASVAQGTPEEVIQLFSPAAGVWKIVSGQQDTGWLAVTYAGTWVTAAGCYPVSYRLQGEKVLLSGTAAPGTAATIATLPTGFRPSSTASFGSSTVTISSAGVISNTAVTQFGFDGLWFRVS